MIYNIVVQPHGVTVTCEEDQTIADALEANGIKVKSVCCTGRCGMCKSYIHEGEVDYGEVNLFALPTSEQEEGRVLLCTATPLSDLVIEIEDSVL